MKKKLLYFVLFVLAVGVMPACDDESTAGYTRITYYPTLEMLGEESYIIDLGSNFEDPGVKADLNGTDVTDQVKVSSDLDVNTAGVYHITYSVTNEDGFSASKTRTIYVADPTPSIISTGMHTVLPGTQREWFSSGAIVPFDGFQILILQVAPGEFYISDFMGGYYDQRAGYGSNYAMTGHFKLNADNTITAIDSYVPGWGDSMDYLKDGVVDPVTGQISYKLGYASLMEFTIIMN